jgi:hypothetical protein
MCEAVVDGLAATYCDCTGTLPLWPMEDNRWRCGRCDREALPPARVGLGARLRSAHERLKKR